MGIPKEPKPAKYFAALLSGEPDLLTRVEGDLTASLGAIDHRSEISPWAASKYYEKEMGTGLLRRFVSFEALAAPVKLADFKLATQEIEKRYLRHGNGESARRVNLDPGYIESGKVVLASTKNANHRIYLRGGIFAEVALEFYDGGFHGCQHTYPDYLWVQTLAFLTCARGFYLDQLRRLS